LHDAVQFELAGVPSALIITEPFRPIVAKFAPTIGAAGFQGCEVRHPVSTLNEQELKAIAAGVVEDVLRRLTN
jgi:hypothetical protein